MTRVGLILESAGHLLGWCLLQAFSPTTFHGVGEPQAAHIDYFEACPGSPIQGNAPGDCAPTRSEHPLPRKSPRAALTAGGTTTHGRKP